MSCMAAVISCEHNNMSCFYRQTRACWLSFLCLFRCVSSRTCSLVSVAQFYWTV